MKRFYGRGENSRLVQGMSKYESSKLVQSQMVRLDMSPVPRVLRYVAHNDADELSVGKPGEDDSNECAAEDLPCSLHAGFEDDSLMGRDDDEGHKVRQWSDADK